MNLEALGAMDDCEHATGKALTEHEVMIPADVIARRLHQVVMDHGGVSLHRDVAGNHARGLIVDLRSAGYAITQVVQTGNKPWIKP
jgi:hypothetical protein